MNTGIWKEMQRIVDEYVWEADLRELLQTFVREKELENSIWWKKTTYTHWMLGGTSPHINRLAAATELILLALDIVDDLQDQDNTVKPWMTCPREYALNGILAFLMGFVGQLDQLQGNRTTGAAAEASRIIARSINGQQRDLNGRIQTADDYLIMVQDKSGSLVRLACFMGYASVPCAEDTIRQMNDLADCIGLIHQIQNDLNDLLRYDVKNDLFAKKRTLPILYLLEDSEPAAAIVKDFYDGSINREEFIRHKRECLSYIQESGCIEYAKVVQSLCVQKADELHEQIPARSPWKERFREMAYGAFAH